MAVHSPGSSDPKNFEQQSYSVLVDTIDTLQELAAGLDARTLSGSEKIQRLEAIQKELEVALGLVARQMDRVEQQDLGLPEKLKTFEERQKYDAIFRKPPETPLKESEAS